MKTKYYTLGSMDEAEGLTTVIHIEDDNGVSIGYDKISSFYKSTEITEERYLEIQQYKKDNPTMISNIGGILSEEGLVQYKKFLSDINTAGEKKLSKKIARIKKWAKKQTDIDLDDIIDKLESKFPNWSESRLEKKAQKILNSISNTESTDEEVSTGDAEVEV